MTPDTKTSEPDTTTCEFTEDELWDLLHCVGQVMDDRGLERRIRHELLGQPVRWYVGLYEVTRRFGGQEEGGWWYDSFTLIDAFPVKSFENEDEAHPFYELAQQYADSQNEGQEPYTNVNGQPKLVAYKSTMPLRQRMPLNAPHYE